MKTRLPKLITSIVSLLFFGRSLAAPSGFIDSNQIEQILTLNYSLFSIAGPKDPVSWVEQSYAAFISSGLSSLIIVLAVILISYATVNLALQAVTLGSLAMLKPQIIRFIFVVFVVFLFYQPGGSGSLSNELISLWGDTYSAVAASDYVRTANSEYLTAANRVYLETGKFVAASAGAGFINKLAESKSLKLLTRAGVFTKLLGGALSEFASIINSVADSMKRASVASSLAFTALIIIYSIFTTLSGFTWVLGTLLLPLGAALYLFSPTQRIFSTIVGYMIAALFFVILLPLVLTLSLKVVILPDMNSTTQLAQEATNYETVFNTLTQLQLGEQAKAIGCLGTRRMDPAGDFRYGRLVPPPVPIQTTIEGSSYTYLGFDPATNCAFDSDSPTTPYTPTETDQLITDFFGDETYSNLNPGIMNRLSAFMTKSLVGMVKAALIGVLTFFVFIGMMRIIGQLIGAAGIGSSIENPIT